MRKDTYRVALGGLLTAAAVALMFLGSIIPLATFAVPAMASLCVLFFALEYNRSFAFVVYLAISLLSVFLVPDKEVAFLFLLFFGHYPILKGIFENFKSKIISWVSKFAVFNASILFLYWILINVLQLTAVVSDFAETTTAMLAALLIVGNIAFFVYDIALTQLITLYIYRIRPKLTKTSPPERGR